MVREPSFSVVQALTSSSDGRSFCFDDQRVVARGGHGHGEALKNGSIVMHDRAGFAVHEMWSADDLPAKGFADGLMSEADAEYRNLPREMADQVDADTRFMRRAGPGRNDDAFRSHLLDLGNRHLIVAANLNVGAHFADVLHQVVGK